MTMTSHIRQLVSKRKLRYMEDGFNLDLSYISDRVIAMGFPSTSIEAMYRNSMDDVKNMLEKKHKDHYKIYNLCSERSYDVREFHSRVSVYPFDDHNPPEFGMMRVFCEDVDRWLNENERNVAVVHCKAGKGRTGLMICAYLLHCRHSLTAEEVLIYYGKRRTMDLKGVTIPSQKRYVDYYSAMVNESLQYSDVKLYLKSIVIDPLPHLTNLGQQEGYIQFEIRQTRVRPFVSDVYEVKRTDGRINIVLPSPILMVGDVKVEFSQKHKIDVFNKHKYMGTNKLFHFWVNTFFIDMERSSQLTHESIRDKSGRLSSLSSSTTGRASANTTTTTSTSGVALRESPNTVAERLCRSAHNSGGGGVSLLDGGSSSSSSSHSSSILPMPRQLRPQVSTPAAAVELRAVVPAATSSCGSTGTGGAAAGNDSVCRSEEDDLPPPSHNGSCEASNQTIHSHPPARTVCIVEPDKSELEDACDIGIKMMSISDDTLTEQGALDTTPSSFKSQRTRHSSVPMTSGKTAPGGHHNPALPARHIPGKNISVRLKKNQIDKAEKSNKFSDNFNVTLFLVRPNNQTLQEEFSRSNLICQRASDGTDRLGSGAPPLHSGSHTMAGMAASVNPTTTTTTANRRDDCCDSSDDEDDYDDEERGGEDNFSSSGASPYLLHPIMDGGGGSGGGGGGEHLPDDRGCSGGGSVPPSATSSSDDPSLHGMVRNRTAPARPLATAAHPLTTTSVSQSTWI